MTAIRIVAGGDPDRCNFAFDGSLAVTLGDLMYHDTNDVKPASSQADQLTQAANQALFAGVFAGLAGDTRKAADTAAVTYFPVMTDALIEIDCDSNTWEVGDLIAAIEQSNGTQLENQKVTKTTDPALAIGYCVQRAAVATTRVNARVMSRVAPVGKVDSATYEVSFTVMPHASITTRNLLVAREAIEIINIDVVPDLVQGGALTGTVVKATGTAAPASATTPMHTANAINFNATANTVQPITLTATTADLRLVPGERIGLVTSAALSTGVANVSIRYRRRTAA